MPRTHGVLLPSFPLSIEMQATSSLAPCSSTPLSLSLSLSGTSERLDWNRRTALPLNLSRSSVAATYLFDRGKRRRSLDLRRSRLAHAITRSGNSLSSQDQRKETTRRDEIERSREMMSACLCVCVQGKEKVKGKTSLLSLQQICAGSW